MLDDGTKARGTDLKVLDVAQVLEASMGDGGSAPDPSG